MDTKDALIQEQQRTIEHLQSQVENLTEIIRLMQKDKFGSSSEQSKYIADEDQFCLFNEAEVCASSNAKEPITHNKKGWVKKPTKRTREMILHDLPVREISCDVTEPMKVCHQCGNHLKPMGKETVREELEYIPAKLQIVRYVRTSYECLKCKHTPHPFILKPAVPRSLMNHSLASPTSVANVMYQKYVNSMPLYRQEKEWESLGIELSRATMANWIIRCSEDYLFPVIDYLHKALLRRDILHCDETPVQVLKEDGRKPQSKSYMWVYRSGNDCKPPIVLYDYEPSRSGDYAVTYLEGFSGYVHCDGYQGYNKLKNITRCACWAHVRRKFVEAMPQKKATGATLTSAETGVDYCNHLFQIEESLQPLAAEEKYIKRLEKAKPVLDEFWRWLESLSVLKGSALGKAVNYALGQKPYLMNYLKDGRLNISNNPAENAIRPFTLGRKNWLFCDTAKGAKASAAVYSLVETAKANHLDVYTYLVHLLMQMPDSDWQNHSEVLELMMPWSDYMQSKCRKK